MRLWSARVFEGSEERILFFFFFVCVLSDSKVMELELGSGPKKNQVIKKKGAVSK